jgi:hypothetical protein
MHSLRGLVGWRLRRNEGLPRCCAAARPVERQYTGAPGASASDFCGAIEISVEATRLQFFDKGPDYLWTS